MARRKWIDKKTATHFTLVHRPQNDPLIHDEAAPSMVLNPTQLPNAPKAGSASAKAGAGAGIRGLGDLASELGSDALSIRGNEGEAANYGIYFDDTEYDYMQHLRDIGGEASAGAVFVEAEPVINKNKGKKKQEPLEDALRRLDLENRSGDLLDADMLPSKNLQKLSYQAQQDVPDAIAGFQPDMDPRLREVLEALEDDAYVDNEDDDGVFQELAHDGREISEEEFEDEYPEGEGEWEDEDEGEGWESDDTAKPTKEFRGKEEGRKDDVVPQLVDTSAAAAGEHEQPAEGPSQDWLEDFKKFKSDQKKSGEGRKSAAAGQQQQRAADMASSIWTTTTNGGRKKKRKGALTNPSSYSMSSSALVRTEQMSILDARFEKIEEEYNIDDMGSEMGSVSAVSSVSSVQGPTREDFDGMLDDFLGSFNTRNKKSMKKEKYKSGTAQLDEIRRELGPARIRPEYRS